MVTRGGKHTWTDIQVLSPLVHCLSPNADLEVSTLVYTISMDLLILLSGYPTARPRAEYFSTPDS